MEISAIAPMLRSLGKIGLYGSKCLMGDFRQKIAYNLITKPSGGHNGKEWKFL